MKTCKETKSFLHFWLGVLMLEEETSISHPRVRLRLGGSDAWLPQHSPSGCAFHVLRVMGKGLEESPEVK